MPEGVAKNISSRPPHAFHLFHNFYYADVIQSLQILRGIWTPETITCAIIEQISQWLSYVGQAMTNSGLLVNWHFLKNCHQMETQNLVISFDYS